MRTRKGFATLEVLVVILIVVVTGGLFYMIGRNTNSSPITPEISPTPEAIVEDDMKDWEVYTNNKYNYSISYPTSWKVTEDNFKINATAASDSIRIFNPKDNPDGTFFTGMKISYVGGIMNTAGYERTELNGVSNTTYMKGAPHGNIYYINMPDTDSFISFEGADGNTSNEETNRTLKEIFKTFEFTN